MITQMKKYTFLVLHRDYEPFLTQLRDLGVVDITLKSAGLLENDETLQAALQHEDELRKLLAQGAPDQLISERNEVKQRIADAKAAAQQAAVWGEFEPARIQALKEAGYSLRFFACPTSAFQAEWGIKVNEKEGKIYFVVVETSTSRDLDISSIVDYAVPAPEKSEAQWNQEVEHLNGLLAAANARIEAWQLDNIEDIKHQLVEARQHIDWTRVQLSTDRLAEGALCLLEGFCPIDKEPELNAMLASSQVYFEETDPTKEDATPIKLRNNWFVKLFEPLTGMYGWPNYNYSYYGRFGEVVAYDDVLGEEDRRKVEKYLMAKWGLCPEKPVLENMLPKTTELTVAAGATLDLAGTYQEVARMELEGEIVNSSATLAVLRLGDGVSTVSGGFIGENVELQVRPGAVLDLGGGTLTVDWARSVADRSNIVNGTLVVRKGWRRPFSPGFVLIVK